MVFSQIEPGSSTPTILDPNKIKSWWRPTSWVLTGGSFRIPSKMTEELLVFVSYPLLGICTQRHKSKQYHVWWRWHSRYHRLRLVSAIVVINVSKVQAHQSLGPNREKSNELCGEDGHTATQNCRIRRNRKTPIASLPINRIKSKSVVADQHFPSTRNWDRTSFDFQRGSDSLKDSSEVFRLGHFVEENGRIVPRLSRIEVEEYWCE